MYNCLSLSYGHEKKFTKSEDYFHNRNMFREDWNKGILKIAKIICIITFKILI